MVHETMTSGSLESGWLRVHRREYAAVVSQTHFPVAQLLHVNIPFQFLYEKSVQIFVIFPVIHHILDLCEFKEDL